MSSIFFQISESIQNLLKLMTIRGRKITRKNFERRFQSKLTDLKNNRQILQNHCTPKDLRWQCQNSLCQLLTQIQDDLEYIFDSLEFQLSDQRKVEQILVNDPTIQWSISVFEVLKKIELENGLHPTGDLQFLKEKLDEFKETQRKYRQRESQNIEVQVSMLNLGETEESELNKLYIVSSRFESNFRQNSGDSKNPNSEGNNKFPCNCVHAKKKKMISKEPRKPSICSQDHHPTYEQE